MIKIQHPSKPMNYYRLSDETWEKLSLKEKDYLILVNEKKHTKEQLMRRLYIESRC
jgi:PHD/YefM family antitoxin component YafN of YafNO toxin-antitoxin module